MARSNFYSDGSDLGPGILDGSGDTSLTVNNLPAGNHTITADYGGSGDGNFAASDAEMLTEQVTDGTTTSVSSNATTVLAGSSVTFTATVSGSSGDGTTPTGTVDFYANGSYLGNGTLSGGSVSLAVSNLSAGLNSITASYGGDSNFIGSDNTASPFIQPVTDTSTTVTSSSANPSTYGPVTFTALVSGTHGGIPTGSVEFYDGTTDLGPGTLSNSSGSDIATLTTVSNLNAGSHSITADYGGDSNFTASESPALSQQVTDETTTSVSSNATTVLAGSSVTFTATVSGSSGDGTTPTGTVDFYANGSYLGNGTLSGGSVSLAVSNLSAGLNSITASYGGDSNFIGSDNTASPFIQPVTDTSTTVTSSSANPSTYGPVTFTALVSGTHGGIPTGSVEFYDGTTDLGPGTLSNSSGSDIATLTTVSNLNAGSHSITADYGGDSNFTASESPALSQQVTDETTTSVSSNATTVLAGSSVTFTATVSGSSGDGTTPTGTVDFYANGSYLGNGTLSGGSVSLAVSNLSAGLNSITASYGGDSNFIGSDNTASPFTQPVTDTSTTSVSSNATTVPASSSVMFTATVSGSSGDGTTPTGTVDFYDNGSYLGYGTLSGGSVSLAVSGLCAGVNSITASYGDDSNFTGSDNTASPFSQNVDLLTANPGSNSTNENVACGGSVSATDSLSLPITYSLAAQAGNGVAVVNSDGSYTYTPNAGFYGTDAFIFTAADGNTSDTATITITVNQDLLTANPGSNSTNENVACGGSVSATDSLSLPITYSLDTQAGSGVAVVNSDGSYTYTPNAGTFGPDSFSFTATDGNVSDTAAITITVNQDLLTATGGSNSTNENVACGGSVSATDSLSLPITYSLDTQAGSGVAVVNSDGSYTYTPNAGFYGTDSFSFTAADGNTSDTATITITVNQDLLTAIAGSNSTNENQACGGSVTATDSLSLPITYSLNTQAGSGVAVVNSDGSYTYTPNTGFIGTDSFSFTATDGNVSDTAAITITVNQDLLTATGGSNSTNENVACGGSVSATDSLSLPITYSLAAQAGSGVAVVNSDGSYTYTPNAGFYGSDAFSFTATDGKVSDTAIVSINVAQVQDTITANSGSNSTTENVACGGSVTASDSLSLPITYSLATQAGNGVAVVNSDGSYTYTPNTGFYGTDTFSFTATDGKVSDTATVTITVAQGTITATGDTFQGENGGLVTGSLAGDATANYPLANLTFELVSGPANASDFQLNSDGSFSYIPAAGYYGLDTFTYRAVDGTNQSNVATVAVLNNFKFDCAEYTQVLDAGSAKVYAFGIDPVTQNKILVPAINPGSDRQDQVIVSQQSVHVDGQYNAQGVLSVRVTLNNVVLPNLGVPIQIKRTTPPITTNAIAMAYAKAAIVVPTLITGEPAAVNAALNGLGYNTGFTNPY